MEWPAFLKEKLEVGSLKSCNAVCTLWTEKERISVPRDSYAVKGNLYSVSGIGYLLRNLLANPKIRYLVVCGEDRTGSGRELIDFFAGNGSFIPDNMLRPHINSVRKGVKIIDMRGREGEVAAEIAKFSPLPPHGAPVFLPEEAGSTEGLKSDCTTFRLESESIADMWLKILDVIMKFGREKPTEHGLKQKEVINLTAVLRGRGPIRQFLPFRQDGLDNYIKSFFSPEKGDVSYTYGERLYRHPVPDGTIDQISAAIEHLKKTPHTRRAAAFTWNVERDAHSENPPCMTQVVWNISAGRLVQTVIIRSNDMFGGWPFNAFAVRELQEKVAGELKIPAGDLIIISNSAHIYENNFAAARSIVERHYTGRGESFIQDELGYFTISIEKSEIVARHFTVDGRPGGFVFREHTAKDVYLKILHENLVSRLDHAAYLGRELCKAEQALKAGYDRFEQNK